MYVYCLRVFWSSIYIPTYFNSEHRWMMSFLLWCVHVVYTYFLMIMFSVFLAPLGGHIVCLPLTLNIFIWMNGIPSLQILARERKKELSCKLLESWSNRSWWKRSHQVWTTREWGVKIFLLQTLRGFNKRATGCWLDFWALWLVEMEV